MEEKVTVSTEKIGPDEAREMLSKLMPRYRPVDPQAVHLMANMMRSGIWKKIGNTLKRDDGEPPEGSV